MLTNAEHVTRANYMDAVARYTAGRGSLAAVELARSEYARATDAGMIARARNHPEDLRPIGTA